MGLIQDPRFSLKASKQHDTPPALFAASDKTNPATPHPIVNANWTQPQENRPTFKKDEYGIDLCHSALTHFMRNNNGQVPDDLWVSDDLLPEIKADMLTIYGATYCGSIPFLHGMRIIKPICIHVDDSLPKTRVSYVGP